MSFDASALSKNNKEVDVDPEGSDLRNVGISVGGMESDAETGETMETPPEGEDLGPDVAGPVADQQGATPMGAPAPAGVGM